MRNKTIFAACSALAMMVAASAVQAQTSDQAPPTDQPQVEPTQTLPSQASTNTADTRAAQSDELVVTARRREESLKDVPIAVSAVTDATLKQQQIYTVREIAAYVPGLNINSDSVGRAFISIRGIGTTLIDTVQPGVGIFIDGIYQPNTSYLNSPLVDIARVEVLRGPQGTLFGNNTLGGAVNVITRQPTNHYEGKLDAAYAGPDEFKSLSGSISGPIVKDLLQFRLGAAYHHHDGFMYNTIVGADQNPVTQKTVNGSLRFLPSSWATFTLNASYDQVFGGSTGYLGVTGPRDYSLDGGTNQRSLAKLTYRGLNGKGEFNLDQINTKVTAIAAYNRRDASGVSDADFGPVDFARGVNASDLWTWTGEVRADTNWNDKVSTLVGVYAEDFNLNQASVTSLPLFGISNPSSSVQESKTEAVFGTVFLKPSPDLELAIGLRYDHQLLQGTIFDIQHPTGFSPPDYKTDQFQPRVTLTKHWTPDWMTYASVARGFRGGGQNGPGAPHLTYKGDSVWTYELGTKFSALDNRLSIDADVFYNDYSDFIGQNSLAASTTGVGIVAINLNTGKVKSYGAEAEGHFRVTDNWRLDGSLTLLHSRITDDSEYVETTGFHVSSDRIIFTPDWNFSAGTTYTIPLGDNSVVLNANVVGKGSRPGSSLNPDVSPVLAKYYLVNGSVAYQVKNIEVALFATNLFNEKYIESYIDRSALDRAGLHDFAQNLAIQGDRRRIGVRTSLRF